MGNKNDVQTFYNNFQQLFILLEYLARKHNFFSYFYLFNGEKYKKIYETMERIELLNNIKSPLNYCENNLNKILDSPKYIKGSLFSMREIKQYIGTLTKWKEYSGNDTNCFQRLINLFNIIKMKEQQNFGLNNNNLSPSNKKSYASNINNIENIYNINNSSNINKYNSQFQQEIVLDKQKVIQAQDLTLLNDNFGRALASLECYANRFSKKNLSNMFDYYNMFNLGNTQNMNELYKKAFVQTQIFKLAYDDYIKKYHKYTPPQNLDLGKIKSYLKEWMFYVDDDAKVIYQGMINIFYSLNNSYFDKKFRSTSQKYKNAKMDPKKICCFASGVYYYNHQRCEEAKSNYMKNGQIVSSLQINQNYKDDKNAIQLQQNIMNNKESFLADSDLK
jgi:hypothetical protein